MPISHLWSAGARHGTEGRETAALLVPIHCWSQLPSTDGTQDQERPQTPTSQRSYGTASHGGGGWGGAPREDLKESTSRPDICKAQQSPNLAFGSPGLAPANLLSGCLSKPIKTNH